MRTLKLLGVGAVVALLSGCAVYGPPPPGAYYQAPAPYYQAPAPYYAPPAYYGPSVGIGIYGGRGYGYGHRHYR